MKSLIKILTKKKLKFHLLSLVQVDCLASTITSISGASKIFNLGLSYLF